MNFFPFRGFSFPGRTVFYNLGEWSSAKEDFQEFSFKFGKSEKSLNFRHSYADD